MLKYDGGMDRRSFLRLSAGSAALAMLPLSACTTSAPPAIERAVGPTAIMDDGTRFVVMPTEHALVITGADGERRVGGLGTTAGKLNFPIAVAVVGELAYVVDCGNHRVQVFDRIGRSVGVLGEGELLYPKGIVASATELLVADTSNARIVGFALDGDVVRTLGEGTLSAPRGLARIEDALLVTDGGLRKVMELDDQGRIRRELGAGWIAPRDVATDGERIYVADATTKQLAVFERSGRQNKSLELEVAPRFMTLGADGTLYVS